MTTDKNKRLFRVAAEDFKKIPGNPIAYWISQTEIAAYDHGIKLRRYAVPRQGFATGDNNQFLRFWHEISLKDIGFNAKNQQQTDHIWYPCNKGGGFRRWFGNNSIVANWGNNGAAIKNFPGSVIRNSQYYFREGITWSTISSFKLSMRYSPEGYLFESKGSVCFPEEKSSLFFTLGFTNSTVVNRLLLTLAPTLDFHEGPIGELPLIVSQKNVVENIVSKTVTIAHCDWDSYETSWGFQRNPLIEANQRDQKPGKIAGAYLQLRSAWQAQCEEMRRLEVENNRIFIDAYGLKEEMSPEVPWNEITLTCNPWYRYGKTPKVVDNDQWIVDSEECHIGEVWGVGEQGTVHVSLPNGKIPADKMPFNQELENRLLEDTVKEFISYAVGCMMGRYSPEKPGLILANQGESYLDYLRKITDNEDFQNPETPEGINTPSVLASMNRVVGRDPYRKLPNKLSGQMVTPFADYDGVLPILDEEWFSDDIVAQFKSFLRFTFGQEHYDENLQFIEGALGKDIRKYFVKDFYKDHVQRYKKRPIYWLFSSPKGSFNALIYLHRYTPDTVGIVRNDYLLKLMEKMDIQRKRLIDANNSADMNGVQKIRNMKLIDKYVAMYAELQDYERDIIFPILHQPPVLDLDDGVKVNYLKLGKALKKIPGLESKEE